MNRISVVAGSIGLFFLLPVPVWSQPRLPYSPSDQEMLMLPDECKIFIKGSPEKKNLLNKNLPGLVGPNHYCWGLNFMNRAKFSSLDNVEKRFNLQSAIGEFGYVLEHSDPNAKGLQQVKAAKGQAELMLKMLLQAKGG